MKNLFKIIFLALIVSATGCSTIEDLAPPEERKPDEVRIIESDLKVYHTIVELDNTDGQGFNHPIDINRDGIIDFYFKTERKSVPDDGERYVINVYNRTVSTVSLEPAQIQNAVVSQAITPERICSKYMYFTPVDAMQPGDAINASSEWSDKSIFCVHVTTAYDCTYLKQYVKNDVENTFGIRFIDNRVIYYGWIKIVPEVVPSRVTSHGPNKWTIVEYGFSDYPGKGVVVN